MTTELKKLQARLREAKRLLAALCDAVETHDEHVPFGDETPQMLSFVRCEVCKLGGQHTKDCPNGAARRFLVEDEELEGAR